MATNMLGHAIWAANSHVDLSGSLFCFANVDATTGDIVLPSANGATVGIITEAAPQNQPTTVQLDGVGKVILGSTLSAGVQVESDGSGHAVAHSTGFVAGILLTGGNSGDVVSIKLS